MRKHPPPKGNRRLLEAKETEAMKAELCRILNKIGALEFGVFKLTTGRTSPYYIDLRIVPSFPDALEFGAFKLTTGRTSPYYIDLRIVPSFPDAFRRVCDLYLKLIRGDIGAESFDRIAGIPTAGIAFASFLAYNLKKPFLYTRPQKRLHGRERRVEGIIMPGDRVLLIDDLVTTGRSLRRTAAAIRAEGGVVSDAVVLLDREEGGREKLTEDGVSLHSLVKASEAADKLHQMGAITEDQLRTIKKQVKKK